MAQLSDTIERFIKDLMEDGMQIEVRRNELAQHFGCAPSQINYVLATRFSVAHGYLIESRRGGGGYVRILRIREPEQSDLLIRILQRIGNEISYEEGDAIISLMDRCTVINRREALLMSSAIADDALTAPVAAKDLLRAGILRNMVVRAFRNKEEAEKNAL